MKVNSSLQNHLKEINVFYNKMKSAKINWFKEYKTFTLQRRFKNIRPLTTKCTLIKTLINCYCSQKRKNKIYHCNVNLEGSHSRNEINVKENLSMISEQANEEDQKESKEDDIDLVNVSMSCLLGSIDVQEEGIKKGDKDKKCDNRRISGFKFLSEDNCKVKDKDNNEVESRFKLSDAVYDINSNCNKIISKSTKRYEKNVKGKKLLADKNNYTKISQNKSKSEQSSNKINNKRRNICIKIENNFCGKNIDFKYKTMANFNKKSFLNEKNDKAINKEKGNKNKYVNKTSRNLSNSIISNKENINSININDTSEGIFESKSKSNLNCKNIPSSSIKYKRLNTKPLTNISNRNNKKSLKKGSSIPSVVNIQSKKEGINKHSKKYITVKRKKIYNRLMHKVDSNNDSNKENSTILENFITNNSKECHSFDFVLNSINNKKAGKNSITRNPKLKDITNIILNSKNGNKSVDLRKSNGILIRNKTTLRKITQMSVNSTDKINRSSAKFSAVNNKKRKKIN